MVCRDKAVLVSCKRGRHSTIHALPVLTGTVRRGEILSLTSRKLHPANEDNNGLCRNTVCQTAQRAGDSDACFTDNDQLEHNSFDQHIIHYDVAARYTTISGRRIQPSSRPDRVWSKGLFRPFPPSMLAHHPRLFSSSSSSFIVLKVHVAGS